MYDADQRAQDIVYDAWEAPTAAMKFDHLRQALKIFPFSVDALNARADVYVSYLDDSKENLEKAEQTYELAHQSARLLWPNLEQQPSISWGMIGHRPFLRTYHGFGVVRKDLGKVQDAVEKFRFLLRVNPNDNQGARVILLFHILIESGEYQEAETIAENHCDGKKSTDSSFRYGFVLIDYSKFKIGVCSKQDLEESLVEALQNNKWVPLLLLGEIPFAKKTRLGIPRKYE
jgi:tetratricopeptide (TPR) repeat protein